MQSQSRLRQMIMDAIADDYEQLESILSQVRPWAEIERVQANDEEIIRLLIELITDGSAKAFRLSPTAPPLSVNEISPGELHDLYFLLSERGRSELAG